MNFQIFQSSIRGGIRAPEKSREKKFQSEKSREKKNLSESPREKRKKNLSSRNQGIINFSPGFSPPQIIFRSKCPKKTPKIFFLNFHFFRL